MFLMWAEIIFYTFVPVRKIISVKEIIYSDILFVLTKENTNIYFLQNNIILKHFVELNVKTL